MVQNKLANVAVCLAVHNGMKWLPTLLSTVITQTGVSLTVFISVDPSTDGSETWIKAQAAKDPRIVLLPQGDHLPASSQNFFRLCRDVDFSTFDYVSFADQDDVWMPNRLLQAVACLTQTESVGYSSNVIAMWDSGKPQQLINKAQPQVKWDFLFEAPGPGCTFVLTHAFAIKFQQHLLAIGDAAIKLRSHDWFIYAYARGQGEKWIIDSKPTLYYRQHDQNDVGANEGVQAARYRWQSIVDGTWLQQIANTVEAIGMQENMFVQQWLPFRRRGFITLIWHARKCRRRVRDKALFAVAFLYWAITGWKAK